MSDDSYLRASVKDCGITFDPEFKALCTVQLIDGYSEKQIDIAIDEMSTRIMIIGGLQYLVKLGDPIAEKMVKEFMSAMP